MIGKQSFDVIYTDSVFTNTINYKLCLSYRGQNQYLCNLYAPAIFDFNKERFTINFTYLRFNEDINNLISSLTFKNIDIS
jgi:hypothetical protein